MLKKKLKPGSLPTLNMPLKSHNKETKTRRKITKVFSHEENKPKKTYVYESFLELTNQIQSLKISSWSIKYDTDRIVLKMYQDKGIVPKYEVCIDDSLGYSIAVYNWILPRWSSSLHKKQTINEVYYYIKSFNWYCTLSSLWGFISQFRIPAYYKSCYSNGIWSTSSWWWWKYFSLSPYRVLSFTQLFRYLIKQPVWTL